MSEFEQELISYGKFYINESGECDGLLKTCALIGFENHLLLNTSFVKSLQFKPIDIVHFKITIFRDARNA